MTDLKPGVKIEYNGVPHEVISASFSRSSQSKGYMTTRLRNLITGNVFENVFRDRDNIISASIDKRKVQFLYKNGKEFAFMDNENFEQFELSEDIVGDKGYFMKEGDGVELFFFNGTPISIGLAAKVVLKITETEPGIKAATASDVKKQAITETGYKLQVPSFINEGDNIRINTTTGEYVERA